MPKPKPPLADILAEHETTTTSPRSRASRAVDDIPGPKHARATDNGRYYEVPSTGDMYVSVTNAINEWNIAALAPAAAKETANYIVDNLPDAVRAARRTDTRDEFLRQAKAQYRMMWERRRDLGSLVHHMAEARILGKPVPDHDEARPFIAQYERFLADFGVDIDRDVESAEITVLHHGHRYGGTADLWLQLRFPADRTDPDPRFQGRTPTAQSTPSGLWLIDIKTSLTKPPTALYRDMILQLAALRYAQTALLPDDTETPVPRFVGAAILNLRTDDYGFIPLGDVANEQAHAAFRALVPLAYFAHQLDLKPYKPIKAPARAVKEGVA